MGVFRHDVRTVVVALVVSVLVAGGPALADRSVNGAGTAQTRCHPGAVLAFADVNPENLTSSYSMKGVAPRFNCADTRNRVLVKKVGTGDYYVNFPGISDSPNNLGDMTAAVSTSDAAFRTIGYFDETDSASNIPHVVEVEIALNSTPQDLGSSIALFGFKHA